MMPKGNSRVILRSDPHAEQEGRRGGPLRDAAPRLPCRPGGPEGTGTPYRATRVRVPLGGGRNRHRASAVAPSTDGALRSSYDDKQNGRITCQEARRHSIAPIQREHPACRFMRDSDNDSYSPIRRVAD